MAVGKYTLPICDGCKLPWLPTGWKQTSDPRDTKKPLRCGKCKSSGWDRDHKEAPQDETVLLKDLGPFHPVNPELCADIEAAQEANRLAEYVKFTSPVPDSRCRHRMRLALCPICSKEKA